MHYQTFIVYRYNRAIILYQTVGTDHEQEASYTATGVDCAERTLSFALDTFWIVFFMFSCLFLHHPKITSKSLLWCMWRCCQVTPKDAVIAPERRIRTKTSLHSLLSQTKVNVILKGWCLEKLSNTSTSITCLAQACTKKLLHLPIPKNRQLWPPWMTRRLRRRPA